MTIFSSISQIWRDFAEAWRELFTIEPALEVRFWLEDADDDERDVEARERERIELAIMTAHFHF